jgi:hypothetical protein
MCHNQEQRRKTESMSWPFGQQVHVNRENLTSELCVSLSTRVIHSRVRTLSVRFAEKFYCITSYFMSFILKGILVY